MTGRFPRLRSDWVAGWVLAMSFVKVDLLSTELHACFDFGMPLMWWFYVKLLAWFETIID
jgi:hypothetical protein